MLERLIVREDKESVELANRTVIEVGTASFRSTRGYTLVAALCDEVAFWRSEDSANPDFEIIQALRPGLATLNGKLIVLSSPYSKKGFLYESHRRYYGTNDPHTLVAQAPSLTMNPSLPKRVVDEAYRRDAAASAAEFGAEFRSDIEGFIQRETVEGVTRSAPLELAPEPKRRYSAFIDPAGGGADEFTLAIGHIEDRKTLVVDVVRGRTGTPSTIVAEYAELLRAYRIRDAVSDKYGGTWPADEFARHGIKVEQSAKPKSDLYRDTLPVLNSGRAELPPDDRLMTQLTTLERRTARGGRESIDHPPGGHDDRANAIAGLVANTAIGRRHVPLKNWI